MRLILFLSLIFCTSAYAGHGRVIVDQVNSVYDGDTFRATIKQWPPLIGFNIAIRVSGIDTPEIRGKCKKEKIAAQKAREFAKEMLENAETVILENIRRGKYFRVIADVKADGVYLSEQLIDHGHARPYHGGGRLGWCFKN